MKIKLQINGQNIDDTPSFYDKELINPEHEIIFEIDEKNLEKLEELLEKIISNKEIHNIKLSK